MVCDSTRVRIARFTVRSKSRPRVALERDGVLYDVEALEEALGAAVPVPGDAWDFHTRVVALGCAGLRELDASLLQGKRPASSRVPADGVAHLAPCDTDRAQYVQVDLRGRPAPAAVRLCLARALAGQDALVDLPRGERRPDLEVGLGVLIGDDLRDASVPAARSAILGLAVLIEWCARGTERDAPPHATVRGLRVQLGPTLVSPAGLPNVASLAVSVTVGGRRFDAGSLLQLGATPEEAVALASSHVELRAGDLVGLGPLALDLTATRGRALAYHDPVEVSIERIGTLRGAAVERR